MMSDEFGPIQVAPTDGDTQQWTIQFLWKKKIPIAIVRKKYRNVRYDVTIAL